MGKYEKKHVSRKCMDDAKSLILKHGFQLVSGLIASRLLQYLSIRKRNYGSNDEHFRRKVNNLQIWTIGAKIR